MESRPVNNLELAREAKITKDSRRQLILAIHPSNVVRCALAKNPYLCEEALIALGDNLGLLRVQSASRVRLQI